MPSGTQIRRLTRDGVVVLELVGEFDLAASSALRAALREDLSETKALIIDLSQTTFMDSSALGALVAAHRKAEDQDREIRLTGLSPSLRRVFRLMALDTIFQSFHTVDAALAVTPKAPSPEET